MYLRAAILCLLTACTASSAPAPFPRKGVRVSEVVFDAGTAKRARIAEIYLRSHFLPEALGATGHDWTSAKPRIEVRGSLVRVWVNSPDAVSLLKHLAATLKSKERGEANLNAKEQYFLARGWERADLLRDRLKQGTVTKAELVDMEETLGHLEFQREAMKIHQRPRVVSKGW